MSGETKVLALPPGFAGFAFREGDRPPRYGLVAYERFEVQRHSFDEFWDSAEEAVADAWRLHRAIALAELRELAELGGSPIRLAHALRTRIHAYERGRGIQA